MIALQTKGGISIAGAVKGETDETLTLLLPDKTEESINLSDIASRTKPSSSMPPMGLILSPEELRDLVEYLNQLK